MLLFGECIFEQKLIGCKIRKQINVLPLGYTLFLSAKIS